MKKLPMIIALLVTASTTAMATGEVIGRTGESQPVYQDNGHRALILNHQITVGFTMAEVLASLGRPTFFKTVADSYGTVDFWHYVIGYGELTIRFENGIVTNWIEGNS